MAYVTTTSRAASNSSYFADLKATFARRLAKTRDYRTTVTGLSALDDCELNDLGLARADIRAVAQRAALRA
jgi:uncharacterized protein YjiS (DUF1127 family)